MAKRLWREEKGSVPIVLRDGTSVVMSKFTRFNMPVPGLEGTAATLTIESEDKGRPKCTKLEIQCDGGITWETLRAISVDSLVKQAIADNASIPMHYAGEVDGSRRFEPGRGEEPLGSSGAFTATKRTRRSLSDDQLREVARIYSEAVKAGHHAPVEAVAREMLGSPWKASTAKGWVMKARKAGYLPPTSPGRKAA